MDINSFFDEPGIFFKVKVRNLRPFWADLCRYEKNYRKLVRISSYFY